MMTEEVKASAARLYESCVFDQLLGETLRPGGLKLTARLAELAGINQDSTVLDIACGKGTTAFFLAEAYHCRVTGIDLSDKMIALCQSKVDERKLADKVSFLLGDAEYLPFRGSSFDVVISECSFSLLPNKAMAATDIRRVLRPQGKLAMTDIILRGEVPDGLRSQVSFACCLAGAWRIEEYVNLLAEVGFQSQCVEDHSPELARVGYRLGLTFGSMDSFLERLPAGPCRTKRTENGVPSICSYQQFLQTGRPGYALLVMTRP